MARYTGPICRLCRREGMKLYLKGERCFTEHCAFDKRPYAPGDHGRQRGKLSQYGTQLRAKQVMRVIYGIPERQFEHYFEKALGMSGDTRENLVRLVESRVDNIVYRLGFAISRRQARQLVTHGHFSVNGVKIDIPSYKLRPGDIVEVREKSRSLAAIKHAVESSKDRTQVPWVEVDFDSYRGTFLRLPNLEEVTDLPVDVQAIVEFYSR
ncbi:MULTISPECIES: 30S ribosomal protein S4 [Pseudothermotoga]|uniref:Small ribosomal subunit protein uS4 n=1 Tax=Pseudothermotoga lettingae (strain ATCC BAA-301 / DSM 14385 / NBRC 107922 / TMO) TaxID=416591 RepID=RS4_PSELT|nr:MULTISPECIES: 30S ribosomal protein S4 [Pseudothermotoga]A8F4T8.1 RecName: Full=Small ribosomal subunit protein uS4; AltName: Full=30S ribosomal protein S4 [Pseudothermotoga lettingae TMO]ABV33172.1 RNA-binding S4 domain protein [Pseudothermotoga lettingae TMO]KUK21662.1 MAG: 30S ribosomal protein S4 [Pseudothermotoga lettingae]MDI3494438.1 small subunit ribosomal protein [Pseudothermotoga sp.]MDK2884177.1 small subunit ribosomal protein [Pseudothermotoga sp.]GLI49911.1 30S ribosomal prote